MCFLRESTADNLQERKLAMLNIKDITKEKLEKLYHSEMLTIREIAKVYNCNNNTISKKMKKWSIPILHTQLREIKKYHLDSIQKDAVIGMMLGDSSIRSNKYCSSLFMTHCAKQLGYLKWKSDIFGMFSNPIRKQIDKNGFESYRYATKFHPDFNYYRWLFYKNYHGTGNKILKKKALERLTPLGLAIWIMDDGCYLMNHKKEIVGIRLYVGKHLNKGVVKIIQGVLKNKFDLSVKVYYSSKTVYEFRITKAEYPKLMNIIKKHIPECMQYKFPPSETIRETPKGEDIVRAV